MTRYLRWLPHPLIALLAFSACEQSDQDTAKVQLPVYKAQLPGYNVNSAGGAKPVKTGAEVPAGLRQIVAERREACGGKVGEQFGETLTADFNGDGKADYVLSQENFLCTGEPAGPETWGIVGPQYDFLVSSSAGHRFIDGFSTRYGIDIKKRPAGDVVQLQHENMSTEGCGGVFTITWSWTGKKMEVTDRRNEKGAKVDRKGCPASSSGDLPIKLGYYGYHGYGGDDCAHTDGITITDKTWRDIDGDYPLRPVVSLGKGRYNLGRSYTIQLTGPDRFAAWVTDEDRSETERRFVWCAAKAPK